MPRKKDKRKPRNQRAKSVIAVTFEVMQNAATHPLQDPMAAAQRLKRGDIIDFVRTDRHADWDEENKEWRWRTPVLMRRSVFIHARGFDESRFAKARRRFREYLSDNNIGSEDETAAHDCARKQRWRVDYDSLPGPVKADLNNNKEATMSWQGGGNPLQPLVKKKRYNDMMDPESDDEIEVSEEDVPEDIAP